MRKIKTRLDVAMVERALAPTRAKAQSLIMARRVRVNGVHSVKAGADIEEPDVIEIDSLEHPWVGRGGMKLAGALASFDVEVAGKVCADIGASTGGFTHVLLTRGALRVYAIDVGYGQLDQLLREDPRVVNREKVNARFLTRADFPEPIELVSVDVSFISLRIILPAVADFIAPAGELVALIKPQFEVGREAVGRGGIVRDVTARSAAVDAVLDAAKQYGFEVHGVVESPITGAEGNVEYLMYARRANGETSAVPPDGE